MKHLEKLARKQLGNVLLDEGLVSKSQLADAEREQRQTGGLLGSILVESGYITDWDLAKAVSSQYQLPFVHLGMFPNDKVLTALFPIQVLRNHRFVPLDRLGSVLTLAVSEMPDMEFLNEVKARHAVTPFLFVAPISEIMQRIEGGSLLLMESAVRSSGGGKAAGNGAPAPAAKPAPRPALSGQVLEFLPRGEESHTEDAPEDFLGVGELLGAESVEVIEGLEFFDRILPDDEPDRRRTESDEVPEGDADESGGSWENIFDIANASVLGDHDED